MERIGLRWRALLLLGLLLGIPATVQAQTVARMIAFQTLLNKDIEEFSGFDDAKTTLKEAMDHLAEVHHFTYQINYAAFRQTKLKEPENAFIADPRPVRPLRAVTLETILQSVLERLGDEVGATILIRRDHFEITTRAAVLREFYPGRHDTFVPPLSHGSFKEVPLDKALKELTDLCGGQVLLDSVGAKESARTPITAEFANMPLDTAVRLLADMAGLQMIEMDRVLYVTTRDKAESLRRQ